MLSVLTAKTKNKGTQDGVGCVYCLGCSGGIGIAYVQTHQYTLLNTCSFFVCKVYLNITVKNLVVPFVLTKLIALFLLLLSSCLIL